MTIRPAQIADSIVTPNFPAALTLFPLFSVRLARAAQDSQRSWEASRCNKGAEPISAPSPPGAVSIDGQRDGRAGSDLACRSICSRHRDRIAAWRCARATLTTSTTTAASTSAAANCTSDDDDSQDSKQSTAHAAAGGNSKEENHRQYGSAAGEKAVQRRFQSGGGWSCCVYSQCCRGRGCPGDGD